MHDFILHISCKLSFYGNLIHLDFYYFCLVILEVNGFLNNSNNLLEKCQGCIRQISGIGD